MNGKIEIAKTLTNVSLKTREKFQNCQVRPLFGCDRYKVIFTGC